MGEVSQQSRAFSSIAPLASSPLSLTVAIFAPLLSFGFRSAVSKFLCYSSVIPLCFWCLSLTDAVLNFFFCSPFNACVLLVPRACGCSAYFYFALQVTPLCFQYTLLDASFLSVSFSFLHRVCLSFVFWTRPFFLSVSVAPFRHRIICLLPVFSNSHHLSNRRFLFSCSISLPCACAKRRRPSATRHRPCGLLLPTVRHL